MGAPASSYTAAREELVREQIEFQRMKNERMRGTLVPLAEHQQEMAALVATVRAELLALPGRIGRELALNQRDALAVDRIVREALNRLAGTPA